MFAFLQGATASPSRIAVSVVQNCAEELEPFVCGFLTSCILDRDAVGNELKEFYHEIIFEIFQCAPQMLLAVIPNLTQELLVRLTSSIHFFLWFIWSQLLTCSNNYGPHVASFGNILFILYLFFSCPLTVWLFVLINVVYVFVDWSGWCQNKSC